MIKDCNPLNIRYRSEGYWLGQAPSRGHPQFCRFYDMKWGFRAAFRLLLTYYERYHLDTVGKIVTRWAPPSENDTKAYIAFVANQLRQSWPAIRPDAPLQKQAAPISDAPLPHPREQPRLWIALVLAMARMECGAKRIGLPEAAACEEGYHLLFD